MAPGPCSGTETVLRHNPLACDIPLAVPQGTLLNAFLALAATDTEHGHSTLPSPMSHAGSTRSNPSSPRTSSRSHRSPSLTKWVGALVLAGAVLGYPAWRTSPPGFNPPIRISAVRWVRTIVLDRIAERHARDGRREAADALWLQAWRLNPANERVVVGMLENYVAAREQGIVLPPRHTLVPWLVQLTGNTPANLSLAVRVLAVDRRWQPVYELLAPQRQSLSPELTGVFLQSLFHTLRTAEFSSMADSLPATHPFASELPMYRRAIEAIRDARTAGQWHGEVSSAMTTPLTVRRFAPLDLEVSRAHTNLVAYQETLDKLTSAGGSGLGDHINLWSLLAQSGQLPAAQTRARAHVPPDDPESQLQYAASLANLELHEESLRILDERFRQGEASEQAHLLRSDLLVRLREWPSVIASAMQLRAAHPQHTSYSHFLVGLAESGLNNPTLAEESFQRMLTEPWKSAGLAYVAAGRLIEAGRAPMAVRLLERCRSLGEADPYYWNRCVQAALGDRNSALLLEASRALQRLQPETPALREIHKAALLSARTEPVEVLRLVQEDRARRPADMTARIHEALALNLNQRFEEAARVLEAVDRTALPVGARLYHLYATFEVKAHEGQVEACRALYPQIDPSQLFTAEREHLSQLYARVHPAR